MLLHAVLAKLLAHFYNLSVVNKKEKWEKSPKLQSA